MICQYDIHVLSSTDLMPESEILGDETKKVQAAWHEGCRELGAHELYQIIPVVVPKAHPYAGYPGLLWLNKFKARVGRVRRKAFSRASRSSYSQIATHFSQIGRSEGCGRRGSLPYAGCSKKLNSHLQRLSQPAKRRLVCLGAFCVLLSVAVQAFAQKYPADFVKAVLFSVMRSLPGGMSQKEG